VKFINNYIFNFSVSRSGGGFKRLYEYARVFSRKGGAHFIIHPDSYSLLSEFPNNEYHIIHQTKRKRLLNDFSYLQGVVGSHGRPDLYYSYGIPIASKVARVNWFHLSNVLPLAYSGVPMTLFDGLKMRLLGPRIKAGFKNADVISAESEYSLGLINSGDKNLLLSVNGSDDEINHSNKVSDNIKKDIAVVMGTYQHKAIEESYHIFKMLKRMRSSSLKLILAGDPARVPEMIKSDPDVTVAGHLSRKELMRILSDAKFYISTTYIENSYNAASEGIFLAEESFISNILPHLELLNGENYKITTIPGLTRSFIHTESRLLNGANIKSWDEVVDQMVGEVRRILNLKLN